ncbi:response regulator [Candidatus Saganbacteria bacterium]|nr:response regulator [Candidatus Saganbacteria bacterium]
MKKTDKKILVIDDEKDILELFTRVLKDYAVKTTENEKEALAWVSKEHFDIIFLDIIIPEVSSLELFKLLRKMSPKSKIMLMTGFATETEGNRALKLGAAGIMRKPFDHIDDIKRAVERLSRHFKTSR